MDQQRLQACAAELEQLLARLAPADGEVADLRSAPRSSTRRSLGTGIFS